LVVFEVYRVVWFVFNGVRMRKYYTKYN